LLTQDGLGIVVRGFLIAIALSDYLKLPLSARYPDDKIIDNLAII
jgi:hypothetical protein